MTDPARMSDAELIAELERFGHGSLANDERGAVVMEAARRLKPALAAKDRAAADWCEEARRYAGNADYWRERTTVAENALQDAQAEIERLRKRTHEIQEAESKKRAVLQSAVDSQLALDKWAREENGESYDAQSCLVTNGLSMFGSACLTTMRQRAEAAEAELLAAQKQARRDAAVIEALIAATDLPIPFPDPKLPGGDTDLMRGVCQGHNEARSYLKGVVEHALAARKEPGHGS